MRPRFPRPAVQMIVGTAALSLAMFLAPDRAAIGQDSSTDPAPLARYAPKDDVIAYIEFDGLDAHSDAWRKTAAYKILNTTTAGAMLEDVFAQLLDKMRAVVKNPIRSTDSILGLAKHLAQSGFLFALLDHPDDPKKATPVLVLRNAYKDKNTRTTMAGLLQNLNAPNTRPQAVVRAGHKVIAGVNARGTGFTWWVEDSKKEDIVLVFQKAEEADRILETLDGKRPSALAHPRRAELVKPEDGFIPTGLAFVEPRSFRTGKNWEEIGLTNLTALDVRWGFQDDALVTTARIATSGPRKGVLALLDGPTFEKGELPPIPGSAGGFTVLSLDLKSTLEKVVALARHFKPDAEDQVNRFLDSMKATTKLRLKEDVLAHLGPKVAWYILPNKGTTAAPAAPGFFGTMLASVGMDQVPRLAIVVDIDDPVAFGKVLDQAMVAVNREFKAQATKGLDEEAKGSRNRRPPPPAPEFRLKEDPKSYFFSVPPELSSQYPASFRPTIQVGPKHAVFAVSVDVARAVLESKEMWTPPKELSVAFQGLSSRLRVLNVSDPRETLPAILASFPAKLQSAINTAILTQSKGVAPPTAGPPPSGGQPPPGGPPPGQGPGRRGGPGEPGAPGANPAPGSPPTVVIQVDAAKLPSAEAIKSLLFPSVFTVEADGDEVRITSRDAFPAFADPSRASLSAMMPSLMGKGGPPPGASSTPGVVPPGSASPAEGGNSPGRGPMTRPRGGRP